VSPVRRALRGRPVPQSADCASWSARRLLIVEKAKRWFLLFVRRERQTVLVVPQRAQRRAYASASS
jgi:hypothetical protein